MEKLENAYECSACGSDETRLVEASEELFDDIGENSMGSKRICYWCESDWLEQRRHEVSEVKAKDRFLLGYGLGIFTGAFIALIVKYYMG